MSMMRERHCGCSGLERSTIAVSCRALGTRKTERVSGTQCARHTRESSPRPPARGGGRVRSTGSRPALYVARGMLCYHAARCLLAETGGPVRTPLLHQVSQLASAEEVAREPNLFQPSASGGGRAGVRQREARRWLCGEVPTQVERREQRRGAHECLRQTTRQCSRTRGERLRSSGGGAGGWAGGRKRGYWSTHGGRAGGRAGGRDLDGLRREGTLPKL